MNRTLLADSRGISQSIALGILLGTAFVLAGALAVLMLLGGAP